MTAERELMLEERITALEEWVLLLYAMKFRESNVFFGTMPDGSIGKEELDKLREKLRLHKIAN